MNGWLTALVILFVIICVGAMIYSSIYYERKQRRMQENLRDRWANSEVSER